jgi:hypothetical protein
MLKGLTALDRCYGMIQFLWQANILHGLLRWLGRPVYSSRQPAASGRLAEAMVALHV